MLYVLMDMHKIRWSMCEGRLLTHFSFLNYTVGYVTMRSGNDLSSHVNQINTGISESLKPATLSGNDSKSSNDLIDEQIQRFTEGNHYNKG